VRDDAEEGGMKNEGDSVSPVSTPQSSPGEVDFVQLAGPSPGKEPARAVYRRGGEAELSFGEPGAPRPAGPGPGPENDRSSSGA